MTLATIGKTFSRSLDVSCGAHEHVDERQLCRVSVIHATFALHPHEVRA